MKLPNKLKNFFSRIPKSLVVLFVSAAMVAGVGSYVKAEFYPDRPTYDYNKPCNPNDADKYDRCGSLEGPVFNSFINTPSYGDERMFADARRTDQTAAGSYKNVLPDVTSGSREVVIRTYVHNNANQDTNASGKGIAKNTKVRVALPPANTEGNALRAVSYISADNAGTVEDTVDLTGTQNFKVEYVPGSAVLYNYGPFKNGTPLSDSVVTSGAPIGYDSLNGNQPGCFDYAATVQIRVRIMVKETPGLKISKQVRMAGTKEWKKEVAAKPNDKVEWLITTDNTGTGVQNMVTRDVAAPNTALVPGSVKWIDAQQNALQNDTSLFSGGLNLGNYAPGGGYYIMYGSTIKGDFEGCSVRVRNLAYSKSDKTPEVGDDADVIITKENCIPTNPKTPVYACESLTKTKISDKQYSYTLKYTAKDGATLKMISYDFGDKSQPFVTDKTTVEHTYAQEGNYATRATLTFTVDGKEKVVSSDKCAVSVDVPKPPTTPVTPVTVTTTKELPNTGAGDVFGIFAATTMIGAFLHRAYASRKATQA